VFTILYDSFQEGRWFQDLHPLLHRADLRPFPSVPRGRLGDVLAFDRPDIILLDDDLPILVVERTIEVPSGHNVGQRFARLAAAARAQVPTVYFAPYAAYKHGGETQGPRYMNLRLFAALDSLMAVEDATVLTIRWPVDGDYEILRDDSKDTRMKEFMGLFFDLYADCGVPGMNVPLRSSQFQREQRSERALFVDEEVVRPEQYDGPPNSVVITVARAGYNPPLPPELNGEPVIVYQVGMRKIRSDPYTGMALLYSYLYCGGINRPDRRLILWFPNIVVATWIETAARTPNAKHVKLYRLVADAIVFRDGYLMEMDL